MQNSATTIDSPSMLKLQIKLAPHGNLCTSALSSYLNAWVAFITDHSINPTNDLQLLIQNIANSTLRFFKVSLAFPMTELTLVGLSCHTPLTHSLLVGVDETPAVSSGVDLAFKDSEGQTHWCPCLTLEDVDIRIYSPTLASTTFPYPSGLLRPLQLSANRTIQVPIDSPFDSGHSTVILANDSDQTTLRNDPLFSQLLSPEELNQIIRIPCELELWLKPQVPDSPTKTYTLHHNSRMNNRHLHTSTTAYAVQTPLSHTPYLATFLHDIFLEPIQLYLLQKLSQKFDHYWSSKIATYGRSAELSFFWYSSTRHVIKIKHKPTNSLSYIEVQPPHIPGTYEATGMALVRIRTMLQAVQAFLRQHAQDKLRCYNSYR